MSILFCEHQTPKGVIAEICFDKPSTLNAVDESMSQSLFYALENWTQDHRVRLIVIRSKTQAAFSAGADLKVLLAQKQVEVAASDDFILRQYKIIRLLRNTSMPVLVMANSITMGFAAGLFMAAKYRICAPDIRFAMPECAIGFFPDVGAAKFLHIFGDDLADFIISQAGSIGISALTQAGVIDGVFAFEDFGRCLEQIIENAGELPKFEAWAANAESFPRSANTSNYAVAISRRLYKLALTLSYDELTKIEYGLARYLLFSADFDLGLNAFLEKRAAVWNKNTAIITDDFILSLGKHELFA